MYTYTLEHKFKRSHPSLKNNDIAANDANISINTKNGNTTIWHKSAQSDINRSRKEGLAHYSKPDPTVWNLPQIKSNGNERYSSSNKTKETTQIHTSFLHDDTTTLPIKESNNILPASHSQAPTLNMPATSSPDSPITRTSTAVLSKSQQRSTAISNRKIDVSSLTNRSITLLAANEKTDQIHLAHFSVAKQSNKHISDYLSSHIQDNNKYGNSSNMTTRQQTTHTLYVMNSRQLSPLQ